jgi:hypothetical protein
VWFLPKKRVTNTGVVATNIATKTEIMIDVVTTTETMIDMVTKSTTIKAMGMMTVIAR